MSPIDEEALDRLADYTAGLLDSAGAAEVRRLVDTDPDWARAYAGLSAAGPRLDAVLASLADPPLPHDVARRLSAAIAPPARTATVVDLASRRRWRRPAAWIGGVAAALALVFGGVLALSGVTTSSVTSSGNRAAAPYPAGSSFNAFSGGMTIRHSGTDYTAQTLGQADSTVPAPLATRPPAMPNAGQQDSRPGTAAGSALARLSDDVALNACLAAISQRYSGEVSLVDYASFQGRAALIVVLQVGGTRRIVVAGPSCGLPGAGADVRYTVVE